MSYYDLSQPYSIDDWNNLVNAVNEKLQDSPEPSKCEPIDPIDEVSDPHIWSAEDVQIMRNKLIETCPDISFSEPLEIWKPAIIDEIENALEEVWCDCCDDEFLHDEEGTQIELASWQPVVHSNCLGFPPGDVRGPPLEDIIDGMVVGKSGIKGRRWSVWTIPQPGMSPQIVISGSISCEGAVEYAGGSWLPNYWFSHFDCSDCDSPRCQVGLASEAERVASFGIRVYYLEITTDSAYCADCDE